MLHLIDALAKLVGLGMTCLIAGCAFVLVVVLIIIVAVEGGKGQC